MPTIGTAVSRTRKFLNETTARFYSDADIIGWICDGAAYQHRTAIGIAKKTGQIKELGHAYIRRYCSFFNIAITPGVVLYSLAPEYLEMLNVVIVGLGGDEHDCEYRDSFNHWENENIPHLTPGYSRSAWTFAQSSTTGVVGIRVYVAGADTVPIVPATLRQFFIRDFRRVLDNDTNQNIDMDDPYLRGPVYYAVSEALHRRQDPAAAEWQMRAESAFADIFAPQISSAATVADAQAKGAAMQTGGGQ